MLPRSKFLVRAFFFCVAGTFFVGSLSAATRSRWLANSLTIDDGLPNNTVHGVAQTPEGYLWLGTPTGLVRFDGVNFQGISSTNFIEFPNRGILMMIGLRSSGLCLFMDRGAVVMLRGEASRVYLPVRDLPDEAPYSLAEDAEGGLWISYRTGSVRRIAGGKVTVFDSKEGLPEGPGFCALTADVKGRIWFARGRDFGIYRDGKFQKLATIPSAFTRLAMAYDGGIWICSGTRVLKYSEAAGLEDKGSFGTVRVTVEPRALLEDHDGTLWIGTAFTGLFQLGPDGFESVGISHNEVTSLTEDREGNIWVGTMGGGLNQVRPRIVELEGTEDGLPFNGVQSLCEDTNGILWATAQNGAIARRMEGRWQTFTPEPGWTGEALCITADRNGAVWFGTRLRGIFCWRDDKLIEWGNPSELKGKTIHTLQVGNDGSLWIGEDTPNALQVLRNGKLETINLLADDLRVIRAMTEGPDGSIWVGTSRGLLMRIQNGVVVDETANTMSEPASIRCLYTSPDGAVWIGYAGWGLGRIRNGHFTNIRADQGLFDDYISHIVADDGGWLWFGGDRGVFKVRRQELEDLSEGRTTRVRSIHYGRSEGLPSVQANVGSAPGALRSRDGRIWIPMRTALAVAYPDRLRKTAKPPEVLLNRVVVDERPVAFDGGILPPLKMPTPGVLDLRKPNNKLRLPPGHRRVQFQFTAPSFTAPENVHFRYQLEPFDEGWVEGQTERAQIAGELGFFATYSRLPAGEYRFRVIACNSDDVWNEEGATLQVVVTPFFWNTWTFRLAVATAFTLAIIGVVRYVSFRRLRFQLRRLEQQEALHKERARIAKDIHDDVGANLTQIALLGDLARQEPVKPDELSPRLETISTTARQAVKSLDEIVWAVNPRNDTFAHLIDYTGQYALDYLRIAGVRCRLDLPEHTPAREISTDIRHNLFLVVKEALNNIVKHARATEAWLRITATETELKIAVEDNGRGFDQPPVNGWSDGLRNMRQRIADIGGQFHIESGNGGTKIVVELPWPHQAHSA